MRENIGFIGAGNMAQALIQGWLRKQLVKPTEIFVSNRTPGKLVELTKKFGITACATNEELIDKCDIVLIAVKPQDLEAAIEPIASSFNEDQVVISLAAGTSLKKLKNLLPKNQHLVRLMANTPARIGKGTFGYARRATICGWTAGWSGCLNPLIDRAFRRRRAIRGLLPSQRVRVWASCSK